MNNNNANTTLPVLKKSIRLMGEIGGVEEKDGLTEYVMNELLDYKECLEEFHQTLAELEEELDAAGAYTEEYISKTLGEIVADNKPTLEIIINSGGGSVVEGFAMIDAIRELQELYDVKVNTHAMGICASMAVAIFMAGDIRTSGDNTVFMLHQIQGGAMGSQNKIQSTLQFMDMAKNNYKRMFKDTRIDKDELDRILENDKDHYFDIDQAREWGIVNDEDILQALLDAQGKLQSEDTEKETQEADDANKETQEANDTKIED